jgi:hypothetical protein
MASKQKRAEVPGLWVAPGFSLSKRTGPKLIPLPSSKPAVRTSDSPAEKENMARILELADVALSTKKRS